MLSLDLMIPNYLTFPHEVTMKNIHFLSMLFAGWAFKFA